MVSEIEMVFVEGGTFMMGATPEMGKKCSDDERPVHEVTVSDFHIGKYTVTQGQWEEVMGSNPSETKGYDLPVTNVSWDDIEKFIDKLNKKTGKCYRLPTEAEWEYAARGGNKSKGFKYSGSNNMSEVGWCKGIIMDGKLHPVGKKQPNELGLYDMSGNVGECVHDWYCGYLKEAQIDPMGPTVTVKVQEEDMVSYIIEPEKYTSQMRFRQGGYSRVIRGGNFKMDAENCRISFRSGSYPDQRGCNGCTGFRLAK